MHSIKKFVYGVACIALGSMILLGCSEDQGKKQEQKVETTQERMGREAAKNLRQPIEEAHKAAQLETERVKAMDKTARDTNPAVQGANTTPAQTGGKGNKKLEGC